MIKNGLTNAQKHELLILHQQERANAEAVYQEEKRMRKELIGEKKPEPTDPLAEPTYKKLYKEFGNNNKNKDMRKHMQERVNGNTDSKMSTGFQLNLNPGYQMDNGMDTSHFRETFKGNKVEDTDKVYFRKKDEIVNYAEAYVKCAGTLRKN